jgi:glycosyltransferase involved in cell wall biosynthesis
MTKEKAFIILTPGFAAHEEDTIVKALQFFAKEFTQQFPQIHLHVISFQYPLNRSNYTLYGATIHACGGRNRKGFFRILTWIRALKAFLNIWYSYRVKGILSIWINECAVFGQLTGGFFGIKQISWICGQDAKPTNKFLKFLNINSDNVVFQSQNLINELGKSIVVSKPIIIQAGIDPDYIGQIKSGQRVYNIIGVGSLIELKNFSLFIDIVSDLAIEFPTIKAIIVGTGPQKQLLKERIRTKNLESNITLSGEQTHKDTIALMKKSEILLHTSIYEGQGMVLLEALCCGLEVVCFDVGFNDPQFMNVCKDKEEMKIKLSGLLKKETTNPKPVILKTMAESVSEMAALYDL